MAASSTAATILVVDDNPANLGLLESMLAARGYRVLSFTRGDLALRAVARSLPDLVLLDVNMPLMNGYEVCERLKAEPGTHDIPVIFLSAMTETLDKVRAFAAGAVDYVTKPFQIEEIQARIETHLGLQRLQRQLTRSCADLKRSEELKENLVGMIVHDMRTPLTGLTAYLDMAMAEDGVPAEARDQIGFAIESARALVDMVNAMLDVARLESGDFPLNLETCDPAEVIRDGVRLALNPRRRLALTLDVPAALPTVVCDADLVRRVVSNLVANAVKYTPDGGAVRVAGAVESGGLRVTVADSGPGIPPEYRDRVFDKFVQVLGRRQGYRFSTGLGLTFSKLAVEAHGGRIGVESQPGQGSVFSFDIPPRPRETTRRAVEAAAC